MRANQLSDVELVERLNTHPDLRERIEGLLLAIENTSGELRDADAAEMQIIEEMRQLGRETLTAWAQHRVVEETEELIQSVGVWREGKKNCAGIPRSEK